MYRGSVSTFADLCVAIGAASCHVQRVRFWHLKSVYFLGTRWGPPLFEALVANSRLLCVTLMYVARFEQRDSREYLTGASNRPPGRHQIQNVEGPVLDSRAKQMYFRRGPKVDPLRIESGPSWRVCFWPLHFVRCAEALQAAMCEKCQA